MSRDKLVRLAGHAQAAEFLLRKKRLFRWHKPVVSSSGLVVSVTTYPARIESVWVTLVSLFDQTVAPDRVVLQLSRLDFPSLSLPESITSLQFLGLEINWLEGQQRSYKKLLPALSAFPDHTIITADDDVVYPRAWLAGLIDAHRRIPEAIVGHRGTRILLHGEDATEPYLHWPVADRRTPSSLLFLTGVGGILYPPHTLAPWVLDFETAERLAPTADDISFKAAALAAGPSCRKVSDGRADFRPVLRTAEGGLADINVGQARNDGQLKAVFDHFALWAKLRGSV